MLDTAHDWHYSTPNSLLVALLTSLHPAPPPCRAIIQEDIIQPALRASLSWETWRLGHGALPSDCNATYAAQNVHAVQVPGLDHRCAQQLLPQCLSTNRALPSAAA